MRQFFNVVIGKSFGHFRTWLIHERPVWLCLAAVCLAVCLFVAYLWRNDITESHGITNDTLTKSFEETKQAHKGLEAFVLSGFGEEIENELLNTPVRKEFIDAFYGLQNRIKQPAPPPPETFEVVPNPKKINPDITDKYITNHAEGGFAADFLFIPGMLTGLSLQPNASDTDIKKEVTKLGLINSSIVSSQKVAPELIALLNTPVIGDNSDPDGSEGWAISQKPVQSYYLTAAGVIRLSKAKVPNPHAYYKKQFPRTTFFPDRPYFWNTVNDPLSTDPFSAETYKHRAGGEQYKVINIFKTTKPYIDLGGNGVVVTLSRHVEGAGLKSGLFLDFSLGKKAIDSIKKRVEGLNGFATEIALDENGNIVSVGKGVDALSGAQKAALSQAIEVYKREDALSEIFGKLFVVAGGDESEGKGGKVVFTVPVGGASYGGDANSPRQISGALLYCEIDLDRFQFWVSLKVMIIVSSFAFTVGFIFLSFRDFRRMLEEQEKAFDSVADVMARAPVAYCRLNEQDQFINMNEAFATLLGYDSLQKAEESLLHKETFEGRLADPESLKEYADVREKRGLRIRKGPYVVRLRAKEGTIEVTVHGASVPQPKSHPGAIPQTFGILVETMPEQEMKVRPTLGLPKHPSNPAELFVVMPLKEEFTSVYDNIADVAARLKFRPTRGDLINSTKPVLEGVWHSICAARVIIADCTGRNPNVFYEIGLAHVVGKPVILITQNKDDIPFNLAHIRFTTYEYSMPGMKLFKTKLEEIIRTELGLPAE